MKAPEHGASTGKTPSKESAVHGKEVNKGESVKAPDHGASKDKIPSKQGAVHGKEENAHAATTEKPSQPQQPSMFWGAMTAIEKNFVKLMASIQGLFTSSASTSSTPAATAATNPAPAEADAKKEKHMNKDTNTKVHVAQGVVVAVKEPLQKKEGAHPK